MYLVAEPVEASLPPGTDEQVDLSNAIDLSESEDEEEMELSMHAVDKRAGSTLTTDELSSSNEFGNPQPSP